MSSPSNGVPASWARLRSMGKSTVVLVSFLACRRVRAATMILELVFDSRRSPRPSHEHAELSADLTATLIESLTLGPWGLYGGEPVVCWARRSSAARSRTAPGASG